MSADRPAMYRAGSVGSSPTKLIARADAAVMMPTTIASSSPCRTVPFPTLGFVLFSMFPQKSVVKTSSMMTKSSTYAAVATAVLVVTPMAMSLYALL